MQRSDAPAVIRLILWIILLSLTTTITYWSINTWYLLPAMTLQGIVLVHHFSLQHECCHYTPFKTRWLNDVVGNLCGLIIMLPNRFFRFEHCDHHTYTQLTGKDPEMIPMPDNWKDYLWYLSSIPYWRTKFSEIWNHSLGKLTPAEKRFVPTTEYGTIVLEARLMAGFYCSLLCVCIVFNWWTPLWLWWLPVVLGEPFMRAIRMTEHVGRPTVANMSDNTRTNKVSWPLRFLCWNMNYHAEHHYASSVPFHALPELHKKLARYLYSEPDGYLGAHRDIVRQLMSRAERDQPHGSPGSDS